MNSGYTFMRKVYVLIAQMSRSDINKEAGVAMGEWGPHSHKHKLNMADFILNMPPGFFARVFRESRGGSRVT